MAILARCDGCDAELVGPELCRGRVTTISMQDIKAEDYELCRPCMDLMRSAFNPKTWPRGEWMNLKLP